MRVTNRYVREGRGCGGGGGGGLVVVWWWWWWFGGGGGGNGSKNAKKLSNYGLFGTPHP